MYLVIIYILLLFNSGYGKNLNFCKFKKNCRVILLEHYMFQNNMNITAILEISVSSGKKNS